MLPAVANSLQHDGNSPQLQADTHNQQQEQQLEPWPDLAADLADDGPDGSSAYPAVCGLLPPIDAGVPAKGPSGALGSSESDDTPQHQLSTPTAQAAASAPQQQQQRAAPLPPAPQLFGQPGGVITLALPAAGLPAGTSIGLAVPGKPPPAAAAGSGAPRPAAAAGAIPGAALVTGQPVLGVPNLLPGTGFASPPVLQQLPVQHAAAAAAAMAAARTAGSILSGPSALGVPAKAGDDSSSGGGFAAYAGSSSSNSQWCTPACRQRSLSSRGPCFHCGTTYSSQWRSGPPHKPVLCNACGLYFRKVQSLPDHTCQVAGALQVRGGQ